MINEEHKADKEADILLAEVIANFKTVASIANEHILVESFDANIYSRCLREIKEARCEAIQFGFTNFMQNFVFALIYLAQAVLNIYFEGYEYLT